MVISYLTKGIPMQPTLQPDLKEIRVKRLGWSQQELARFLGCSQAAVSRMESSGRVKSIYLKFLATLLDKDRAA
jgi:predicted transcriptional regulator